MTPEQSGIGTTSPNYVQIIRMGYIAILVIYCVATLLSFLFINRSIRMAENALTTEAKILSDMEKINVMSAMTGLDLRSYLLTGEEFYLEAIRKDSEKHYELLSKLKKYPLQPNIKRFLDEKIALRIKLDAADEVIIRLKQQGATSKKIASYLDNKLTPIRSQLALSQKSLIDASEDYFEAVKLQAFSTASTTRLNLLALNILTLLISILLVWFFSKRQIGIFFKLDRTIFNQEKSKADLEKSKADLEKSKADLEKNSVVLKEAIRGRDEMVGVISHELKNPLASMKLTINLLQKIIPNDPGLDGARKIIEKIYPSIERMSKLVSDLLDVTRIQALALKVDMRASALDKITLDVVDTFMLNAKEKKIYLKIDIPKDCRNVFCDTDRTSQILSNLVSNAIKFTNSGGSVSVHATKIKKMVEVQVADTGIGISEDNLPYVFDRFWQAKNSAFIGTGLGLEITKGLVMAQGGQIWVKSKPGAGTTFFFTLPLAEEEKQFFNPVASRSENLKTKTLERDL